MGGGLENQFLQFAFYPFPVLKIYGCVIIYDMTFAFGPKYADLKIVVKIFLTC